MRASLILIGVCLLVVVGACVGTYFMHVSSHELLDVCAAAADAIERGDHAGAVMLFEQSRSMWDKARDGWRVSVAHEYLQEADTLFDSAASALHWQAWEDAHSELRRLESWLTYINSELFPHLDNIL